MNRKAVFILSMMMLVAIGSKACDFCNCYLGINPHYKKNLINLRYQYTSSTGTHMSDSELEEMGMSKSDFKELHSVYELHGQFYPTQKLQLLVTMPFTDSKEYMKGIVGEQHKGFGDGMVMLNMQVFNSSSNPDKVMQRVFAGAGVQVPTGPWHQADSMEAEERVHLPGTGSWGYCNGISYLAKYKTVGINVNASSKISGMNKEGFLSGYRINTNASIYKEMKFADFSLIPYTGLYYEFGGKDATSSYYLSSTGGKIVYAQAAIDFYFNHCSLSFSYQRCVFEKLNGNQPNTNYRIIGGLGYAFN